ncbi:MAG: hypothetical protein WA790_07170 [Sulfitobacter sp.]
MDDLAHCAQNIAEHWAAILAFMVLIIAIFVFAVRRTLLSFCYGLFSAGSTYVAAYFVIPYLVWFFVLGTMGVGSVACEGYW